MFVSACIGTIVLIREILEDCVSTKTEPLESFPLYGMHVFTFSFHVSYLKWLSAAITLVATVISEALSCKTLGAVA